MTTPYAQYQMNELRGQQRPYLADRDSSHQGQPPSISVPSNIPSPVPPLGQQSPGSSDLLDPTVVHMVTFEPVTTLKGRRYRPVFVPVANDPRHPLTLTAGDPQCIFHHRLDKPRPSFKDFILQNKAAAVASLLIFVVIVAVTMLVLFVIGIDDL
ncbi:hypothetical protein H4R34_000364 [Dimargaris verticillata]|uniref:Uncharacterized protein n=1 Tax=Dimargaris verticillata TaxID=2761393 RepID=A0A9W8B796_9FUNG|nr:hypothetical protein H4R34_000364 [Dimargaris verticillata]